MFLPFFLIHLRAYFQISKELNFFVSKTYIYDIRRTEYGFHFAPRKTKDLYLTLVGCFLKAEPIPVLFSRMVAGFLTKSPVLLLEHLYSQLIPTVPF